MIGKRMGVSTIAFEQPPMLSAWAAVGGKKEQEGPLGAQFDQLFPDTMCGEATWEKAEMHMQQAAVRMAANKCGLPVSALDLMIAGDLLGQCVASSYAARSTQVPYLGVYGACSTMIEGLLLAGCMIDGGYAQRVCAAASSHFCTAERQYRFPLAYGGQRTPTAQWTATAAGACMVSHADVQASVRLTHACFGKICDLGVTDANNMGAAMAPAAISTLQAHFRDLRRVPSDYDLIVTGDLGMLGRTIVLDQFRRIGVGLSPVFYDCGLLIFDTISQDVLAGVSGCGCGASVLCGYLLDRLEKRELRRLLCCATENCRRYP